MKIRLALAGMLLTTTLAVSTGATAAVIAGPTLTANGGGWDTTGIGFTANANTALTAFTYQNQGAADTVVLTDATGNILFSLATPASTPSYVASVNWALTSGNSYWLLQTVASNELFEAFFAALPSNADITITQSGTFANGIPSAVTGNGWGANDYWAAFNDITTSGATGAIPEPASWAMMIAGFGLVGATMRRRRTAIAA